MVCRKVIGDLDDVILTLTNKTKKVRYFFDIIESVSCSNTFFG